ncbi:MAG: hypothetical protein DYG94_01355 [Leptolyngbya sp. PLA3]|nr:hypothetical protein [Leptolyngbya sp. PL-A3]
MYLDIVPLPVLMAIGLIGGVVVLMIPSSMRLTLFLTGLPIWLALSRFPALGPVQAVSKATGMFYFAVIAFAAFTQPGPKRHIPNILWLYPLLGFLSIFYVLGAEDRAIAIILRFQWLFLTLAAIMVVRTITTERQLKHVLLTLAIGEAISTFIAFLAVVKDPGAAFAGGLGRVQPWGANQNHVGPIFVLGAPLALYFALRLRGQFMRLAALGAAGLGSIMGLLTASRSVVFPLAGLLAVVGWELRRKPMVVIGAAVVTIPMLIYAGGFVASANVDRLGTLESERFDRWQEYLGVIMEHPVFGIMFETGELAASEEEIGGHAHNAYLDALRVYGLSMCVPLFGLGLWSSWCAFKVWKRRKLFCSDNLLITMLFVFMGMVYMHGMVTIVIYYPNYTWSFFHVLLSALFITMASSRGHELVSELPPTWHWDQIDYEAMPDWSRPYPKEPVLAGEVNR